MKSNSPAITKSSYCPCGTISINFDMEKLNNKSHHKDILLHIAELIDELKYVHNKSKEVAHIEHLQLVPEL